MIHKRPFGDDNSLDVVCKYVRQGEHLDQLGSTVSSRNAPHEAQASGTDFYAKPQDEGRLGSASVPTISNGTDGEFENSSSACIPHLFLVNSRVPKSDGSLRLSFFPEFFEHGQKLRALIQSDEIFSSVVDHPPQISIGPEHQAYVPEWGSQGWTSSSDKVHGSDPQGVVAQTVDNDDDGSVEKLIGTCIIPMPELEASASCYPLEVETKSECKCTDRGSIRCVIQHVMEARQKLRENLGPEIFVELGFYDMGDEVAKKFTEEEEERFHEVVLSNPESLGKNFWDHLSAVFPSRTKKEMVSYYFNVFMLRKRAEQNRFDLQNIDSDNDEWEQSVVGVMEQDEDSVVESPTIQGFHAYLQDLAGHCRGNIEDEVENENENETSNAGAHIGAHEIARDEDYEGDVEDIAVLHVGVSAGEGGDDGHQHFGNFKRSNVDNNDIEDDSCTSFEFQQDKVDYCRAPDIGTDAKQFNQEYGGLCKKSFSSGKVLEDHMRGHSALNPAEEEVKLSKRKIGFEVNEHSGYDLRENPRKSSRFTILNGTAPSIQETVCRMCDRAFESQRALFGHLRHCKQKKMIHCEECGKGFLSLRSLTGHMTSSRCNLFAEILSKTETVNVVRRRSRRVRSKISSNSSVSSWNGSSSITETVDDVEAAKSLMMMSVGLKNWDEFNSACELKGSSSESFVLKPSSENMQIAADGNVIFDGVRPPEMKKQRVEKSDPKLYSVSEFMLCEPEVEKVIHEGMKCSSTTDESSDQLMDDVYLDVTGLESMHLGGNSCRKIQCLSPDSEILDDSGKRGEFQCKYCSDTFRTHQALGGHQTLHRKPKKTVALEVDNCSGNIHGDCVPETLKAKLAELEGAENSMEQEMDGVIVMNTGSVDNKVHKCPICLKEFASGKALGGHKRAHSAKNSGTSEEQIAQKKQDLSDMSSMLDLNMPTTHQE